VDSKYSFKQRIILAFASVLGPWLLRLYGLTWRVKWEGLDNLAEARKNCGRVLFCFWHSRLLGLCYTHRYHKIGIMVSKSFDGEWISRLVIKLGYRVFRGSASRNGAAALVEMLRYNDGDIALTVDGPRGPALKVKPGLISLAQHSGLPIVPITYIPGSAWHLNSWDRFILPKPFTTLTIRYGARVPLSPLADSRQNEMILQEIENQINRIG
jgi:lysophospholipid acyltransferase (LPLAT)-like uncharacterized protein